MGNGGNYFLIEQHPGLDSLNPYISGHGLDLGHHRRCWQGIDPRYPQGILGGYAGESTGAMDLMKGKGAQISLDTGTASTIRPGNGEGNRRFQSFYRGKIQPSLYCFSACRTE